MCYLFQRLQKEREEQANVDLNAAKPETKKAAPVEVVATAKGVPGTPVPGKKVRSTYHNAISTRRIHNVST